MDKRRERTRGAALVELSVVLILLVLLTFGVMEYGWMFFQLQQVTNGARAGAREAVLPDASNASLAVRVDETMSQAKISGYTTTFSPEDVSTPTSGQPITVTVTVPYTNVQLLGMPLFPMPATLHATVTMAKEGA